RARDPWDRLHREARRARLSEGPVGLARGERGEMADQNLARSQPRDLLDGRNRDLGDDVGAPGIVARADAGPRVRVGRVGLSGTLAGPALDRDLDVLLAERRDRVSDDRDPALPLGGLFGDTHPHWKIGKLHA